MISEFEVEQRSIDKLNLRSDMKNMIEMIAPYKILLSSSSTKSESRETKKASKWNILPISKFKSSYHFG